LDTFEDRGWIGVVPFRMQGTRHRYMPPIPTATDFPETNVRTYVRGAGRSGVWFLSLDAASQLAVWGARVRFNLPYHHARMQVIERDGSVAYTSRRQGGGRVAALVATYGPIGDVYKAERGQLDHWLTERYCLFGQRKDGRVYYMDVHHSPWPLQRGRAVISENTLATAAGLDVPELGPELIHYSRSLDVWAWPPVEL
jgi:uncharacterized protein YqjF (DUF2071 family)